MAARLTLTQEVVVQIHDPEPNMRVSYNGSMSVSKTDHCGSNPQTRATIQPRSADG